MLCYFRNYDEHKFSCANATMLTGNGGRDNSDEVPQDISAFYGHPLTAATHSQDGEALALLHEYQSMQANDTALTRRFNGFHQLDEYKASVLYYTFNILCHIDAMQLPM